jgi:multiple sugar transport system substrate-binding protein
MESNFRQTRRSVISRAAGGVGVGALAMAAAACGTGSGGPAGSASGQPVSFRFLGRESGSEVPVYKQAVDTFNAAQSRVKVELETASGDFDQKLQTMVAGGTTPDAGYLHSQFVPTYVVLGVAAPLDNYAKKDKAVLDNYLPAAVDSYRFKNVVYGVPDVATSLVMYINKTIFSKAGASTPAEKWTWSDYLSTAQRIQSATRDSGVFPAGGFTDNNDWPAVLWQNGADLLDKDRKLVTIDRPEAVEAVTWLADQITKTKLHQGPGDVGPKGNEQDFLDGKVGMLVALSSRMGIIAKGAQFDVEVVHMPAGKQRVTRTACGGTAMYKGTKAGDGVWEFFKYLSGDDFQWSMAKVGGIIFPAGKKVANDPQLFAGQFPKSPKVTVDALAYARTEPYIVRYVDMKNEANKQFATIWKGESSVRDALTKAKAAMDPIAADAAAQMK